MNAVLIEVIKDPAFLYGVQSKKMILNNSGDTERTGEISEAITQPHMRFDQIIFVICASLIIAATIFGNVLVIITVFAESKLRKVGNFFIVSLAISDLLVGLLVTPVALVYDLVGFWCFGPIFCDVWIATDIICCTASIVNLCVISFDRYNAITQPLRYALKRTASRAGIVIALIWTYSIFIAVPPFLGWSDPHSKANQVCAITKGIGYTIFSTVGAYYLPLIVMIVTYFKVFRATLKRKRNWIPLVRQETEERTVIGSEGSKGPKIRKAKVLINIADSCDNDNMSEFEESMAKIDHKPRRRGSKIKMLTSMNLKPGRKFGLSIQVPSSEQDSFSTTPTPDCRDTSSRCVCSSLDETSVDRDVLKENSTKDFSSKRWKSLPSSTESAGEQEFSDESGFETTQQTTPGGSITSCKTPRKGSKSSEYSAAPPIRRTSSEKRRMFQRRMNPSFNNLGETSTTSATTPPPTTGSDETTPEAEGQVKFSFRRRSCKFQFKVESEIQEEDQEVSHGEEPSNIPTKKCSPPIVRIIETTTDDEAKNIRVNPQNDGADDSSVARSLREKVLTIERARRRLRQLRRRKKNKISLKQERRAAKTLGIIMGCFILCWLPFFVLAVIRPFCESCEFDPLMVKAFTWLGYLNSALNPIIYTFFNQDFRTGFQRIICCVAKR